MPDQEKPKPLLESPLDRDRVVALVEKLHGSVADHLREPPLSPARGLEALNALAMVVAAVLAGTDQDPRAISFFKLALQEGLNEIIARDRITVTVGGNTTEH